MGSMHCDVKFGYQLSICSGTKGNHWKPWLGWLVTGPSGCKLTSCQKSGIKYASSNSTPYLCCFFLDNFRVCWCGAPSLTRCRVCTFQFFLGIANTTFLRSESDGTHDNILLSLFFSLPNLEGQVPVFIFSRNRVARLYPQALGFTCKAQIKSHYASSVWT
jgi:hypothetical protein